MGKIKAKSIFRLVPLIGDLGRFLQAFTIKGYYDQKSPYLFFLYFESMYYKYLPSQILSHDFDEKSDFLNYEFSIRLPAFKYGRVQNRVGSREDMTSSSQDIKTNLATLECRRVVRGSCFILRRVFLPTLALEKIMQSSCCVV